MFIVIESNTLEHRPPLERNPRLTIKRNRGVDHTWYLLKSPKNTNQPRRKECRSAKLHPNNCPRPSKGLGTVNTKGTFWYLKTTQNTLPVFKIICEARWPFLCGCYCPTCHLAVHHPHTVSITGCPWPVMCTERRTENISQCLHRISTSKNRKRAEFNFVVANSKRSARNKDKRAPETGCADPCIEKSDAEMQTLKRFRPEFPCYFCSVPFKN